MKIAYLTGEYPRATDTFIQREVHALRDLGFSVDTFSVRRTAAEHHVGPEQQAEYQNTVFLLERVISLSSVMAHMKLLLASPGRYFDGLAVLFRLFDSDVKHCLTNIVYFCEAVILAETLKKRKIQHLHNHFANSSCSVALLASVVSGIPYSFTIHGPSIFFEPRKWRLDVKTEHAAFVSCISHFCRSQLMLFSAPKDWNKLFIVHCGVPRLFHEMDPKKPHTNEIPQLLFVGRLAQIKGLEVLFNALAMLKQDLAFRLTLVGDGAERGYLEERATQLGLAECTDFVGYKAQADVAALLRECDLFVLPSFAEGVPVVLMEALAAAKPAIATNVAGVSELVEHGHNGFLVSPGDFASLLDALRRVLGDENLRKTLGEHGKQRVEADFSSEKEARWIGDLFKCAQQNKLPDSPRPNF
ncbi:MAG: glycosyltransferase [Pseudomonadota bacterium]